MIDVKIVVADGTFYNSKVTSVPSVGDSIELTSYTDMKNEHPFIVNLKVNKVLHELIEFEEGHQIVKEHHHIINIHCTKI